MKPFVRSMLSAAVPLLLTACTPAVLNPQGPIGQDQKTILVNSLAIMLAIVVPTIIATLAFAWWFRASNKKAKHLPTWAFSGRIELVVWAIPVMVILLLGGVTWVGSYQLDPARPLDSKVKPLDIQVVSLDWKWLFIYPDQRVAAVNQLVVPAGVPLHFSLTSSSVMNTFFVPQLGSMIYTMNGMTTELNLLADKPGVYRGMSAHFSGDGFSGMHFDVKAVSPDEFAQWARTTASTTDSATLDVARYVLLSRPSTGVAPHTFKSVDDGLFKKIVTQHIAPAPGGAHTRTAPDQASASEH